MPKKAEEIRKEIEDSLRKEHPNWTSERISSVSYATVQRMYKKKGLKLPF
jgi:hypothetical protein